MVILNSCLTTTMALLMGLTSTTVSAERPQTAAILQTGKRQQMRAQLYYVGFCDDRPNGFYADPDSCVFYYRCFYNVAYKQRCNAGLYFNPKASVCDWPRNVDCDPDSKSTALPKTTSTTPWTAQTNPTMTNPPGNSKKCPRMVCYFSNWAQYRSGKGKFKAENIDPTKCTHIIYAFATLTGNRLAPTEWNDESTAWAKGNYKKVIEHKKANPQLKVLLAVGGWNMRSRPFVNMVATAVSREEFVNTSISFLRSRGFDGLDLDWEYPALRGSSPQDKDRFVLLCQELKAAFIKEAKDKKRKSRLLLTMAVAAGKDKIDAAYDIRPLSQAVDFINLMSYDFHGGWDSVTGHNSPLYKGSWETGIKAYYNVETAVDTWLQGGAPKDKLVLGLPLYGRSFRLAFFRSNTGVGAPASGAGYKGPFTQESGILSYYEICRLKRRGGRKHFIQQQKVPYLVSRDLWIGYDDPSSLSEKIRFMEDKGLGGVLLWDISLDDFHGVFCGEGKNPLINAVHKECNS